MRRTLIIFLLFLLALTLHKVTAQEKPQKEAIEKAEEEEEPVIFKFEPEYLDAMAAREAEIRRRKAIIDTLAGLPGLCPLKAWPKPVKKAAPPVVCRVRPNSTNITTTKQVTEIGSPSIAVVSAPRNRSRNRNMLMKSR